MGLWGGRFTSDQDAVFKRFNDSLAFDAVLLEHDVRGSIAWARAICGAGVLTRDERDRIVGALEAIADRFATDLGSVASAGDEDIHAFVERHLIERVGELGKKLHTGRSRNDQVATDLRLWSRARIGELRDELRSVREALVAQAEGHCETVFPGFTHLQLAQPVVFGHWCLAYAEMFERDSARLDAARIAADECPLGCGALAGTAYPVDREAIARDLGFARPSRNSLDAASDRDFVLDLLNALSVLATHCSRLAEDLIVYASGLAGLVRMSDAVSTGSSLMPQKKNPDALELIRGKAAHLITAPTRLATVIKGLPLAYNKDLQEDKPVVFGASDDASLCLRVLATVIETMVVDADRGAELAASGYTNATDLADNLVRAGVPFRDAHDLTGRLVNRAVELGVALEALPHAELPMIDPRVTPRMLEGLSAPALVDRRDATGGTAPARVREAVAGARARLLEPR